MAKKKTDISQSKFEELENRYLRAVADYQNLEKRTLHTLEQARKSERKAIITRFVEILDDLEKAQVFVDDEGLKMISDRFKQILSDLGVEEIGLQGNEYDPYASEAVEIEETDDPGKDNIVTEVIRKAYRLGDDVIRTGQVRVAKVKN